MRPLLFSLAATMLLTAATDAAPDTTSPPLRHAPKNMTKAGWILSFQDEFTGHALNIGKWIDSYPDDVRTHSNNELEYYAPDGYYLSGGQLHLKAERRTLADHGYTSGMVTTYGKFAQKYGWFEMRARMPHGKGLWPAFWLLPSDKTWPPEIDILEVLCDKPNIVYLTNHWLDAQSQHQSHGQSFNGPDLSQGFHTYAVDWEPSEITWYVDGVERSRSTEGIPTQPMYVIANLAVGGDWPGNPDATTPLPNTMDIDYIRVYQKAGSSGSKMRSTASPTQTVAGR